MKNGFQIVVLVFAFLVSATACDTPVFRYALEKWAAGDYRAFVFFEDKPEPEEEEALSLFQQCLGNITFEQVSVAELDAGFNAELYEFKGSKREYRKSREQIEAEKKRASARRLFHHKRAMYNAFASGKPLPRAVVMPPLPSGTKRGSPRSDFALWEGGVTPTEIASLLDSPARMEIAKRILAGDSAVWVMIPCGDPLKDDACLARLTDILKKAEETVVLSVPVEKHKISGGVPLKLAFSIVMVDPDDPDESFFVKNLLRLRGMRRGMPGRSVSSSSVLPPDVSADSPAIIPFIGRGRAIELVEIENINEEYIIDLCRYISGPCSCEIKQQNPGMDMLFSVDWKSGLVPMIGADEGPGALRGLGALLMEDAP